MTAILQDDGTLLVPVDACAAERVTPGDPRYAELLAVSFAAAGLRGIPEEDAALAASWERNFDDRQPRSA